MYVLFADETNTAPKQDKTVRFFVYGGLIIPSKQLWHIDKVVDELRAKYGFKTTDSLKFASSSRPKEITTEAHAKIKSEIIDLCISTECKFIALVVLHDIARKRALSTIIKWGANEVFSKFNSFLRQDDSYGFAFVDRMSDSVEYGILIEKFTRGLIYEHATKRLERIRLYGSVCDNSSNFSSISDIILGTFRYCINKPNNEPVAKGMMKKVVKLLWARREGKNVYAFEKGLIFRPVQNSITKKEYKDEYSALLTHINALLGE